jgi:hypothetical protein
VAWKGGSLRLERRGATLAAEARRGGMGGRTGARVSMPKKLGQFRTAAVVPAQAVPGDWAKIAGYLALSAIESMSEGGVA